MNIPADKIREVVTSQSIPAAVSKEFFAAYPNGFDASFLWDGDAEDTLRGIFANWYYRTVYIALIKAGLLPVRFPFNLMGMDLQYINLSRIPLRVDVSGANVAYANLEKTDFAVLLAKRTRFDYATALGFVADQSFLNGSTWRRASLQEAILTGAMATEADFTEANLSEVVANRANFQRAKFRGCRCIYACFRGANLRLADFSDADLTSADFRHAVIDGAIFTGAITDRALGLS